MEKNQIQEKNERYYQIISGTGESYDEQVLIRSKIESILPLKIRWIDGKKELLYSVSHRLSIREYYAKESLNREEIIHLMNQIKNTREQLEEYLLEGDGLIISPDSIFFDVDPAKWMFAYSAENKKDFWRGMSGMIEFFLEKTTEQGLSFFLYRLHEKANEDRMTMELFCSEMNDKERVQERQEELSITPRIKQMKQVETIQETEHNIWVPILIATMGITVLIVLWENHIFINEVTNELRIGMLTGVVLLVFLTVSIGIWRTWPFQKKEKDLFSYEDYKQVRLPKMCLINRSNGELLIIQEYPYEVEECLQIGEEEFFYILNRESHNTVYKNGRMLIPWKREPLEDGDIIKCEKGEYVVELS